MKEKQRILKRKEEGITLIALVITIIVLLILAGVSIAMLTGKNGILSQAQNAREQTEISSIKERAELVKLGLQIDDWTKKQGGQLEKFALVSAIQKEFEGSTASGSVVTTDNGYDIRVDDDLNITVVKHQEVEAGEIAITYEQIPTESRVIALRVYATVEGKKPYDEYATEYLDGVEDGPEMIEIFMEGYINMMALQYGYDYNELLNLMLEAYGTLENAWKNEIGGFSTVEEFYQEVMADSGLYTDYKDMMISMRLVDPNGYDEQYGATIVCNGETQTVSDYADFVITKNGQYNITATNSSGASGSEIAEVTQCEIETFSEICESNTTLEIDGYKVTVPAGFAYGTSENVGHVTTGLVITDSVDSDGNSTGNEFVWIPVKEDLTVGNTGKKMAKVIGAVGYTTTDYEGVLYDFDGTTSTEMTNYGIGTDSYREPDVVDGNRDVAQAEYNAMINSAKINGGFYVGRYEMGTENETAISKIGVYPTSASDEKIDTGNDYDDYLYGLYNKAKTYTNSKNSVTSSMIWGSQYDAMLNFALTGNDKEKIDSEDYGNYSAPLLKTGATKTSDSINNIYDLGGNLVEYTLEKCRSYSVNIMTSRGGGYADNGNFTYSPAYRHGSEFSWNGWGSRLTLYIK